MFATFVIVFHTARADNLLQTLRLLTAREPDVAAASDLRLVCQDRHENLPAVALAEMDALLGKFGHADLRNENAPHMRLPALTNIGVASARTDKLVVLESDRVLPAGYFAAALAELSDGLQITTAVIHKLSAPATDEDVGAGRFQYREDRRTQTNETGRRNAWSGNVAITKRDYDRVGGMDEHYEGYGWADCDMTRTIEAAGVRTVFRPETELHLWHPPSTYGDGDQKQMFIDNGLYYCKKWGLSVPDWLRAEIAAHRRVLL